MRNVHTWTPRLRLSAWLLTLLLLATGCATPSKPTPPDLVTAETLPPISRPAVNEPGPSGDYWTRHCKLLRSVQQTVKPTEPLPALCGTRGPLGQ